MTLFENVSFFQLAEEFLLKIPISSKLNALPALPGQNIQTRMSTEVGSKSQDDNHTTFKSDLDITGSFPLP